MCLGIGWKLSGTPGTLVNWIFVCISIASIKDDTPTVFRYCRQVEACGFTHHLSTWPQGRGLWTPLWKDPPRSIWCRCQLDYQLQQKHTGKKKNHTKQGHRESAVLQTWVGKINLAHKKTFKSTSTPAILMFSPLQNHRVTLKSV